MSDDASTTYASARHADLGSRSSTLANTMNALARLAPGVGEAAIEAVVEAIVPGGSGAILSGAVGGATAMAIKAGADYLKRQLSDREAVRVCEASMAAIRRIAHNHSAGAHVRNDGFFDSVQDDRSAAAELVEGMLRVAQREFQERKVDLFGNIAGNIPFQPGIDRSQAATLLRLGERLSYRQLCFLQLVRSGQSHTAQHPTYVFGTSVPDDASLLLVEVNELISVGLVNAILQYSPTVLAFQGSGMTEAASLLCSVMNLEEIPEPALETVTQVLKRH